ncbi:hypothetical protein JCM12141A_63770 [Mycolicibacterium hodleri]
MKPIKQVAKPGELAAALLEVAAEVDGWCAMTNVDAVLQVCSAEAWQEARALTENIHPRTDLSPAEQIAILAILCAATARKRPPPNPRTPKPQPSGTKPVVLSLVGLFLWRSQAVGASLQVAMM